MSDDLNQLRHALEAEGLTVRRSRADSLLLDHGVVVEVIGRGRYRVVENGHPIAPFSSAAEAAGFIRMDWAQRGWL